MDGCACGQFSTSMPLPVCVGVSLCRSVSVCQQWRLQDVNTRAYAVSWGRWIAASCTVVKLVDLSAQSGARPAPLTQMSGCECMVESVWEVRGVWEAVTQNSSFLNVCRLHSVFSLQARFHACLRTGLLPLTDRWVTPLWNRQPLFQGILMQHGYSAV